MHSRRAFGRTVNSGTTCQLSLAAGMGDAQDHLQALDQPVTTLQEPAVMTTTGICLEQRSPMQ